MGSEERCLVCNSPGGKYQHYESGDFFCEQNDEDYYYDEDDDEQEARPPSLSIFNGTDWELEEEADRLLNESRRGVTKHSEKKDFFSPGQMQWRKSREVYVTSGIPDESLFLGLARRAYAPGREKGPRDLRDEGVSKE